MSEVGNRKTDTRAPILQDYGTGQMWQWSVGSFGCAVLVYWMQSSLHWPMVVMLLFGALFAAFLIVRTLASSAQRTSGILLVEGGFQIWRPFRRPDTICYADIARVTAYHGADPDGYGIQFSYAFEMHDGSTRRILNSEAPWDLLAVLQGMPGWLPDEAAKANEFQPRGPIDTLRTRFTIYLATSRSPRE